jgi:hypothetical protein
MCSARGHANEVVFLMFRIKGSADLEFGEVFLGYLISPKSSPSFSMLSSDWCGEKHL